MKYPSSLLADWDVLRHSGDDVENSTSSRVAGNGYRVSGADMENLGCCSGVKKVS